jgi:hypothetical protein
MYEFAFTLTCITTPGIKRGFLGLPTGNIQSITLNDLTASDHSLKGQYIRGYSKAKPDTETWTSNRRANVGITGNKLIEHSGFYENHPQFGNAASKYFAILVLRRTNFKGAKKLLPCPGSPHVWVHPMSGATPVGDKRYTSVFYFISLGD